MDDDATTTVTEELSDTSGYGYVRAESGDANKGTLTVVWHYNSMGGSESQGG